MSRTDLSQSQWDQLQPLLPPEHSGKKGRPYVSHRSVINGILWRLRTGAPWRDLPTRYGPYQTCADRLARWSKRGLWQTILQKLQGQADTKGQLDWQTNCADGSVIRAHQHAAGARHGDGAEATPAKAKTPTEYAADQALGYSQGGFSTKIHLVCDGKGRPLAATISPGQAHESQHLGTSLDKVRVPRNGRGRPRKRPK